MIQNSEVWVPHAFIGVVIGRGGESIRRIQAETGCNVQVRASRRGVSGAWGC
jgi:predicted PilT family ATPase